MKDYYTVVDNQNNFIFFDKAIKEVMFDKKVTRRSGMAYDLDKARKLKEKAIAFFAERLDKASKWNDEVQSRKMQPHEREETFNKIKENAQANFNSLANKEFSIVRVTFEVIE